MDISVVIPTLDRAHTLPRALDSVLAQSHPPCEIIVVDDGSTDGTPELVGRDYPGVRCLSQQNLGVSAARNAGIRAARGDWIALLDSDDAWQPDKLLTQIESLEHNPGHRICHTEEIWIRRGVRVNAMKKHAKRGGRIFLDCLPLCVISPSSVLLKRELFDEVGLFDESLPACEDYDLWLRICARENVLFVDTPEINKYGGHEDQLSRRFWGMDRFRVTALLKLLKTQSLDEADRRAAEAMLIEKARILEGGARKRGNLETADYYEGLQRQFSTPHSGAPSP